MALLVSLAIATVSLVLWGVWGLTWLLTAMADDPLENPERPDE